MYADGEFFACDKITSTIEAIFINDEELMDLVASVLDGEIDQAEIAIREILVKVTDHVDTFHMHSDEIKDGVFKVIEKLESG